MFWVKHSVQLPADNLKNKKICIYILLTTDESTLFIHLIHTLQKGKPAFRDQAMGHKKICLSNLRTIVGGKKEAKKILRIIEIFIFRLSCPHNRLIRVFPSTSEGVKYL